MNLCLWVWFFCEWPTSNREEMALEVAQIDQWHYIRGAMTTEQVILVLCCFDGFSAFIIIQTTYINIADYCGSLLQIIHCQKELCVGTTAYKRHHVITISDIVCIWRFLRLFYYSFAAGSAKSCMCR